MGVAVTIAGGGGGLFLLFFSELLSNKKTGRGNEATEVGFATGNCESCTRPISTNPGSMEAGVYGQTRGMCLVARRLEVVAVAGLMWISWCVLVGVDFLYCFLFIFFSSNAHDLQQV